jgi:hypothetical protein
MVNYSLLDVGDPLAFVFAKLDLKWMWDYSGKCCNTAAQCFVVSNGTTSYLDEHES